MKLFTTNRDSFYPTTFYSNSKDKSSDFSLGYSHLHVLSYFDKKPNMTGNQLCSAIDKHIKFLEKLYGNPESNHPATYENQRRVMDIRQQLPKIMDELIEKGFIGTTQPEMQSTIKVTAR